MTLQSQIAKALAPLIGEAMWAAGLAGIVWLQFGDERVTVGLKEPRIVGTHALHISSPWEWREKWGDVRADHHSDRAALERLGNTRPVCVAIDPKEDGGVTLLFEDASTLEIEAGTADQDEFWRVFEPWQETPHFVVGPAGVEE